MTQLLQQSKSVRSKSINNFSNHGVGSVRTHSPVLKRGDREMMYGVMLDIQKCSDDGADWQEICRNIIQR